MLDLLMIKEGTAEKQKYNIPRDSERHDVHLFVNKMFLPLQKKCSF